MLSSDEIKVMITALGTSIGKDDFDIAKLRYHKLIIMCDADVDGSHIRTLILTFFYRQMPEIINRGYLYIAQPPLYKVCARQERDLSQGRPRVSGLPRGPHQGRLGARDRHARQRQWQRTNGDGRLTGARLAHFLEKIDLFRQNLDKLVSRGYPADAIKVALRNGVKDKTSLMDPEQDRADRPRHRGLGLPQRRRSAQDEEHGTLYVRFFSKRDGVDREVRIDWNLVTSAEYRAMANNQLGLDAIAAHRLHPRSRARTSTSHDTLEEAIDTLYDGAKKGVSIQRYKGLGEMNPTQLWETTMDPTKRRLLRVQVEDDVDADAIFTVLMGDEVEPRRGVHPGRTRWTCGTWTCRKQTLKNLESMSDNNDRYSPSSSRSRSASKTR